jgi:hypothetical protein
MSVVNTLHCFLHRLLPGIHAARLQALMDAVEAGLSGASLSITRLGQALSGDAFIKHKIKRMDRLVGNPHLTSERLHLYAAMSSWLLKSLPMPIVLIDWSPLPNSKPTTVACLATCRRA